MEALSGLIQAIATLLWPILVFVVLLMFKDEIRDLAIRLKSGKFLGQEIQLAEALDRLEQSVSIARSEVINLPQLTTAEKSSSDVSKSDTVYAVIDLASRSPKAALMLLASEIERELRELLNSMAVIETVYITNRPISTKRASSYISF